ncbi:MAG TPA: YidC/Oxa1 family insertase periplasmic-domain containing protein, partial [Bacteroidia bacterium]|nr:YidC/Oxa1 family insertase periplasmic-domain containing protein [Bacteroidia bacterium]
MKNLDRTSWIGIVVCLGLLFAWGWWNTKEAARIAAEQAARPKPVAQATETGKASPEAAGAKVERAAPAPGSPQEETAVIENEFIRLRLTNVGAGVVASEMKKHPRHLGESSLIAINETAAYPVGSLSAGPKQYDETVWSVVSKSEREVVYETQAPDGLVLRKTFRLPGEDADPYEISVTLEATNKGAAAVALGNRYLYAGSAAPLH